MSSSHSFNTSSFADEMEQEEQLNEEDNVEEDEDSSGDQSERSIFSDSASFPTQEDLESIMVHAPESIPDHENRSVSSVEYGLGHNFSVRSCGSAPESVGSGKDRVSFTGGPDRQEPDEYVGGGGGSSVGGISERSIEVKSSGYDKHYSYSSDTEKPSKVTITHSTQYQYDIAGIESISVRASSVKSDVATICSGSVAEDIEIASVGTAHSGLAMSTTSSFSFDKAIKRKHDRGVEFATETSTRFFPGQPLNVVLQTTSSMFLSSPLEGPSAMTLDSNGVNDMGPPLRRFLLDPAVSTGSRADSVRSIDCSPGTPPRAGSLRSFDSQAASEVVNTDTEDLGSEGHSSHGPDEFHTHSSEHAKSSMPSDNTAFNKEEEEEGVQKVISLNEMLSKTSNGRISPGGTVYKGRGVRRYQGRFMHLPMTRFHQNGINEQSSISGKGVEELTNHNEFNHKSHEQESTCKDHGDHPNMIDGWKRRRSWSRSHSRSPLHQRMDRSRSRSRDRHERPRSKNPVHEFSRRHRSHRDDDINCDISYRGRWRRDKKQNQFNSRHNWREKRRGGMTRRMPPRSAKHRDCSNHT